MYPEALEFRWSEANRHPAPLAQEDELPRYW